MYEKIFEYLWSSLWSGQGHHVFPERLYTTQFVLKPNVKKQKNSLAQVFEFVKTFLLRLKTRKQNFRGNKCFESYKGYVVVVWIDEKPENQ